MDPRTKLLLALLYTIVVTLDSRLPVLGTALAVMLALNLLNRPKGQGLTQNLRMAAFMMAVAVGISLAAFGPKAALIIGIRFICVVGVFAVVFGTTAPEDIAGALVKMGIPYDFAFILMTATEFVPLIREQVGEVIDAQRSRGIPIDLGIRGLRHYPALLMPIIVRSFTLAENLAMAMESRGFGKPGRTFYREPALTPKDYVLIGAGIVGITLWALQKASILPGL